MSRNPLKLPEDAAAHRASLTDAADQQSRDMAGSMSQWRLIVRRFGKHRLAAASFYLLGILYLLAIFAEFFAPYPPTWKQIDAAYAPPQTVRFNTADGLHAPLRQLYLDPVTLSRRYITIPDQVVPLGFFVKGEPYKLCGLIPMRRHFFGVDAAAFAEAYPDAAAPPTFFVFGSDKYGQDIFSRILYGARVSLSVGMVAIVVTFILGIVIGGVSGYVGGWLDTFVQRAIEVLNAFPRLPLWLALGAAMPRDWSPLQVYFAITIVLCLLSWTSLARVVRGKLLALRDEDYATAASLIGAGHARIIFRHLLPGFTSHIIVELTMAIPMMILGETSLSFLGLGLRPPLVSWGVMLQDCMSMQVVANYPWLLLPAVFIIVVVLGFNLAGDGLRDAADPYAN